ncbi:nucleolar protein 4 [Cylas formicarius]|uniref:nucleolar protein 4 n=1 Tax=Cylas formicarius TaxID=197179 RepID=UPI00295860FB|nr:nucleolar protein 4 [Cylas formicarius]
MSSESRRPCGPVKSAKRKKQSKCAAHERNNNNKRPRPNGTTKDDIFDAYQPWVIRTYGDQAKTKTITLKKYARILRTLSGDELANADNSKFRFWVKAKGFCVGKPPGYEAKPADAIVGRYSVCDEDGGIPPQDDELKGSAKDPPLYVPTVTLKNSSTNPTYRKVAVVENFFDIIYNVHVDLEGRPGKHAGQKRTYRTITETYAFLPREAVTRFLLGCTECQKHPRSPSPPQPQPQPQPQSQPPLPTPSPSPTLCGTGGQNNNHAAAAAATPQPQTTPTTNRLLITDVASDVLSPTPSPTRVELREQNPPAKCTAKSDLNKNVVEKPKKSTNPLDVTNLTSKDNKNKPKSERNEAPKLWSPVKSIEEEQRSLQPRRILLPENIDYSMPITTTYLKYMRSLGCKEEDAFNFDSNHENLPTPESSEGNDDDTYNGTKNGSSDITDLSSMTGGDEMAGLWAHYHSALGLAKGKSTPPTIRDQSSPTNADASSAHDETSSSGNKDDEDDDDDDSDDKIDTQTHDPERLKAFNMFVRLFVDENLDRMVPISKQPKEKIQAIIDSCTRQFPEFAERARKRIRTYLKSCRRNKRARDPNSPWDTSRPTPAHLTSVQAEQILATACENESHNAKRMRLGLEPVSQPMPVLPGAQPTDTTASITRGIEFSNSVKLENEVSTTFPSTTTPSTTPNSITKGSITPDLKSSLSLSNSLGVGTMNGISTNTPGTTPTAMYRPNFSQAFQRAGPYPLFPGTPFGTTGLLANGPADLSIKQKPLVNHKLNAGEMAAVRQLITGYRESAAFLLRSADELEQLLLQQQ